jgi:putative acetyltransferase
MAIAVKPEPPQQEAVTELLLQSDKVADRLYPGEYRRPITPDYLAKPDTHVLIARLNGVAVGLCVVFDRDDTTIEVKRMIVVDQARGQGVGAALLNAAHFQAAKLGARAALLEVGTLNIEAQALYRKAGYVFRGPFVPYKASPISLFMERPILESDSSDCEPLAD